MDPSTHTGVVVLGSTVFAECVEFPDVKGYQRLQMIAERVATIAKEHEPEAIYIEAPATRGVFNMVLQVEVGASIRMALHKLGLGWSNVGITSLKKWTTGKGRADKKQMAAAVKNRWGYVHKNNNIIDAYAIARMGEAHLGGKEMKGVWCGQD